MSVKSYLVVVTCAGVLALAATESSVVTRLSAGQGAVDANDAGPATEGQWPSLGGDYTRNGLSPDEGLIENGAAWAHEIGGAAIGSATVGHDGRVHVACDDGKLYTLDAGGSLLWTVDVNAPLLSTPSIGPDGSLFVGSKDGKLYAIASDGTVRWTYPTPGPIYSSPAVASNGDIYVASTDGWLYALDASGEKRWVFKTRASANLQGAIFASPSIGPDGTVYVAGLYDPNLYALNPADGSIKWACNFVLYPEKAPDPDGPKTGGWPFASPVVGADGTVYLTLLYDSHLYAIEPADGTIRWALDLLDLPADEGATIETDPYADGWSEPVIGPDGMIYVSLDDPYLRAVDPNGTIRWATKLGDIGAFTLTVDANGFVYAACDDGYVYVVGSDGQHTGRCETAGWPAYPIVTAEGTVLVTDSQDYSMFITDAANTVQTLAVQSIQEPAAEPDDTEGNEI